MAMADAENSATEGNPYATADAEAEKQAADPHEVSGHDSPPRRPTIRILPAAIIVLLMWAVAIIPGQLAPMTMVHFMSMQFAPILGAIVLMVWWFASPRVAWKQRFTGVGLIVGITLISLFAGHHSLLVTMIVYGLPVSLTLMVMALLATGSVPWQRRRWIAVGAYSIVMLGALFFRINEMDAAFSFSLVPRWQPTAEDRFLAEIESTPTGPEATVSIPQQAGERDWPGFRGADRRGVVTGVTLATDWDANPPQELWRRNIGPGWSSFCVVGPIVVTQEQRGEEEIVAAYRSEDGAPVWATANPGRFEASMGGVGPRATPTFADGKLFTVGANGYVQCLDAATGQQIWNYDLLEKRVTPIAMWGFASSALVHDGLVIIFEGDGDDRGVIALDQTDGHFVWQSSDGSHAYGSPQLSNIDGVDQILVSNNHGLRAFDAAGGEMWRYDWDIGKMARITQPLVAGNAVYLGTGYGNGTRRVDVRRDGDRWEVADQWTAPLKPYFNDFVHHEGHLYGFDGPIFVSIDAETGEKNWKRGRYGHGQVLLVADMNALLVIGEKGKLVLLEANPEKHQELASLKVFEKGVTWNHPVIADGRLFLRNDQAAVCYRLP